MSHFPGFEYPAIPDDPDLPDIPDLPNLLITDPYLYVYRSDWERSAINFGGKIFINVIPFLESIELSGNLGVWQYNCIVKYLDVDSISRLMSDEESRLKGLPEKLPYEEVPLTLKAYDMNYLGLEGTPYAKLQMDVSARKSVLNFGPVRLNAGVGLNLYFATPLLNSGLIEAVQKDRGIETAEELVEEFMNNRDELGTDIVEKIISELFVPRFGAHIAVGMRLRLSPMIGIYVDGKYLIPISKYDENNQVKSSGILVNTGLSLSF